MYIDGGSGAGQIVLGLYDAMGTGGAPGNKLAQTSAATTPLNTTGTSQWLTLPIPAVAIASGTSYWLAYEISGANVKYRTGAPGQGDQWSAPLYSGSGTTTFSTTMPSPFGTSASHFGDNPWSFYATVQ
jgi:hypothetical protein